MIPFVSVATYLFLAPSEDDVWDPPGGWLGTIQETHPAVCLPKRQKHVLAITNRTSKESIDTDTKRMRHIKLPHPAAGETSSANRGIPTSDSSAQNDRFRFHRFPHDER
jgi:hypothetical protein